nr:uncharacterized protein LOC117841101 [Setaria viridis]
MEALAAVRNEETRLLAAGLMRYSSFLAASSSTRPAVPSSESRGGGLKCDWCGKDNHVEAFYYRKKKAQSREGQSRRGGRSSQGPSAADGSARSSLGASATGGSDSGSPQRSSAGSETHEIIRLLSRLVTSTSPGAAGSVTQPSAPIGSAAASQSSTLGSPSMSTPGSSHGSAGWYWPSSL